MGVRRRATVERSPCVRSAGGAPSMLGTRARFAIPCDVTTAEELEHLADRALLARRFRQRQVVLHLVAVAPTVALLDHVARLGEVGDDTERGALRDPERCGDVAEADPRV